MTDAEAKTIVFNSKLMQHAAMQAMQAVFDAMDLATIHELYLRTQHLRAGTPLMDDSDLIHD